MSHKYNIIAQTKSEKNMKKFLLIALMTTSVVALAKKPKVISGDVSKLSGAKNIKVEF